MADELIENPILNSPYFEPNRHLQFSEEEITNEIIESRRVSAYFIPIPRPKGKSPQIEFETQWTQDRVKEIDHVIKTLITLFEPMVIILLGIFIAFILVAMYLPFFSLMNSM